MDPFDRSDEDKPAEECGVIAVATVSGDAARAAFYGLFALQHRGQEAAGIASLDGKAIRVRKDTGLVARVFSEKDMLELRGSHAIGHTRYSTTGSATARNAQPFSVETRYGSIALAHNGNLVNAGELRKALLEKGVGLSSASDTEVMVMTLAGASGSDWPTRIAEAMGSWIGAFSFVVLTPEGTFAARDPWGMRPLSCGLLPGGGSAAASETCALATLGCTKNIEIGPGEIIELGDDGFRRVGCVEAVAPGASCVFEFVYFSRPDSVWRGLGVHEVRRRFGAALAREFPVEADAVVAVPDSSISAAIGFARESGLPYDEAFVKNRYIGRTFIEPTKALREKGVALKFNVLPEAVRGKRIVMIDDSIVRGTTSGPLVRMLRAAGASEVHLRVASPPVRFACHMGVDMGSGDDLAACRMSKDEFRSLVGADSLEYLPVRAMRDSLGGNEGFCAACFDGNYPFPVGEATSKNDFEC
ncbi:MAG: amidophosphoribosyltransferase [Rectinemataceae bacterium]